MKKYLLFLCIFLLFENAYTQTVPAAQTLPYTQDFSTLLSTSTTYPAGWQGWNLNSTTGSSNAFRTTAAVANHNLLASSTAATTTGGVHNYNGKIGILGSGSSDPSLCVVVNTTGKTNIAVTFDISTIRNTYNGTTETRRNNVELQYCIGSALGSFASVTGSIYRNLAGPAQTGAVTTVQNGQRFQYILPAVCENQSAVQLRWVQRDSTGSGARPSFCIDNVIVCPAPIVAASVVPVCSGVKGSITLSVSAGMPPYTIAWDTVNKAGPSFVVTAVTKNATHPYFGVGFSLGYALDGIQGKELTLTRGIPYTFSGTFPNHPFHISTSSVGGNFSGEITSGVTNSQTQGSTGALVLTPNNSHAALIWYQCGFHQNMGWRINVTNGFITGNTISNLSAGTYTAAVSSSDGCITTITVVVGTATAPTITASNNGPVCEGGSVQFTSSGASMYAWSGANSFVSAVQNPIKNNVTIADSGLYTVVGTAASGCTGTASTVANILRKPEITSFTPTSGPNNTLVTVNGTNFLNTNQVQQGGQSATPSIIDNSSFQFNIPATSISGNIIVINSNSCRDTSDSVFTVINNVALNLKIYMEGLYDINQHQMSSPLFDPLQSDSVVVMLYDENDLSSPAYSVAGTVQMNGTGSFIFPAAVLSHQYYVAVKHRSSLETWSKNPVMFTNNTSFDFTQ